MLSEIVASMVGTFAMHVAPNSDKELIRRAPGYIFRARNLNGRNRKLVVLVHGLGGSSSEVYWNQMPKLLRYDPRVADFDVAFWEYPSNKQATANLLSLVRGGQKLGSVEDVSESFALWLEQVNSEFDYDSVSVAGHSLGGAVAVLAAEDQIEHHIDSRIQNIGLMATPLEQHWLARAAAKFLRWNPHVEWLGGKNLSNLFTVSLPHVRERGVRVAHTQYCRDEIVAPHEKIEFDRRYKCDGVHNWPSKVVSRNDACYSSFIKWLKDMG